MIFVVGGGGLSTSSAVLHINAPAGSTITLSNGGVTVKVLEASKGHTNSDGVTADWYYSVSSGSYGEWTVTAAKNDDEVSKTVTINSADQYDVELTYFVYIVRDGVLDSANFPAVPSSLARGQTSGSYYCFESIGSGATYITAVMRFGPIPTFDKVYTRLVFDVHSIYLKSTTSGRSAHFGIRDNGTSVSDGGWQVQQTSQTAPVILEMDVSAISLAGQYVGMSFYNTAASGCNCYVSNIYLAR